MEGRGQPRAPQGRRGARKTEGLDRRQLRRAERPKIGPHMPAIRASLAETLGVSEEVVNVKAKTNERMDAVGRMEGMMAQAVVLMSRMA